MRENCLFLIFLWNNIRQMDQEPLIIDFSEFSDDMKILNPASYEDKMLVLDMSNHNNDRINHKYLPIQVDALSFIMVIEGELNITIDYIPYKIKTNSFCTLNEKHIINNMSMSEDFRGYHIIIAHDFFRSISGPPPINNTVNPRIKPVIELQEADFNLAVSIIEKLKLDMSRTDHFYQNKLIENGLNNFVCEIWNILIQIGNKPNNYYNPSLYEELTGNFFGLVIKNYKNEHEVSFYANELNVTPVYLSRALKQTTGKTAIQLINDFMIIESKILLRKLTLSIHEIAEMLNFSDQASFSKFFKKHTGESPLGYRKNI